MIIGRAGNDGRYPYQVAVIPPLGIHVSFTLIGGKGGRCREQSEASHRDIGRWFCAFPNGFDTLHEFAWTMTKGLCAESSAIDPKPSSSRVQEMLELRVESYAKELPGVREMSLVRSDSAKLPAQP